MGASNYPSSSHFIRAFYLQDSECHTVRLKASLHTEVILRRVQAMARVTLNRVHHNMAATLHPKVAPRRSSNNGVLHQPCPHQDTTRERKHKVMLHAMLMPYVHSAHEAIKGLGTKESVLNDVLLGRSNADMRAIKQAYQETYRRALETDVKGDLSMKTERLFSMVMAATRNEESAPVIPHELERDVTELHRAMDARVGTDQVTVCSILSHRSDGQIRALAHHWQQKYHNGLEKVIESEFSGHMKDALLLMVRRACDRIMSDAVQLEDAMAGFGTKDVLLVQRVVRVHWDRAHLDQVKRAYAHRCKKDLIQRVKGEIHTDKYYEALMVACLS